MTETAPSSSTAPSAWWSASCTGRRACSSTTTRARRTRRQAALLGARHPVPRLVARLRVRPEGPDLRPHRPAAEVHATVSSRALGCGTTEQLLNYYYDTETVPQARASSPSRWSSTPLRASATADIKTNPRRRRPREEGDEVHEGAVKKLKDAKIDIHALIDRPRTRAASPRRDVDRPGDRRGSSRQRGPSPRPRSSIVSMAANIQELQGPSSTNLNVGRTSATRSGRPIRRRRRTMAVIRRFIGAVAARSTAVSARAIPDAPDGHQALENLFFNPSATTCRAVGRLKLNYKFTRPRWPDKQPPLDRRC